jgi:hypothetical protein
MTARSQQSSSSVWWRAIHSLTKRIARLGMSRRGRSRLVRPGHLPSVSGVKMRWVVIAEEHQNRDSVEGTDPGHGTNVPGRADRFDSGPTSRGPESRYETPAARPVSRARFEMDQRMACSREGDSSASWNLLGLSIRDCCAAREVR